MAYVPIIYNMLYSILSVELVRFCYSEFVNLKFGSKFSNKNNKKKPNTYLIDDPPADRSTIFRARSLR